MSRRPVQVIAENETLMSEWDYDRNELLTLDPKKVGIKSHKTACWKCAKGHTWSAMISNRVGLNRGCPYCAHQLPIAGETDFETLYPLLAKEWHPQKNGKKPSEFMPGTHKKVWWICAKGHEWQAEIKSRVSGVGCPYCANKRILKGYNDLLTVNPELAKEWHPTKNEGLLPTEVSPVSGKRVWWRCDFGHEYIAQISNKSAGRGCPECSKALRTSFPEQAVYYYIRKCFPDAINSYKAIFSSSIELDIYIPSINVGIEYDGRIYHSAQRTQLRDSKKYQICKENGVFLIRIREMSSYTPLLLSDRKIEIPNAEDKYLDWAINNLCYHLGKSVDVNVRRDRKEILAYRDGRKTSFASEFPTIAAEWDYAGNAPLKPESLPPHSNEKVSWRCRLCGHKWVAALGDRTREKATGCPMCARKRIAQTRKRRVQMIDKETNEVLREFSSMTEASKETGVSLAHISAVCREVGRKQAGGYIWKYCGEKKE